MPKKEVPLNYLQEYLPSGTGEAVLNYLQEHKVHLTITRERKSILGDYRHRTHSANHRISVNGNLNHYAFLITLLHELAHLLTFEQYTHRVMAHGVEWKQVYARLLQQFLQQHTFPGDIEKELIKSLRNPAASSCAEEGLTRILKKYDERGSQSKLVEDLPVNTVFKTNDGRVFRKGEKLRKRFKCKEMETGKEYLFSPVHEVEIIAER